MSPSSLDIEQVSIFLTLNSVQDVRASWCTGLGLGRLTADDCASRGGHSGGGGAPATLEIVIFQKQVTLFTKSNDTLEFE